MTFTIEQRINQLVAFVEGMREPDVVRPDEENSIRHLAALIAEAAQAADALEPEHD